MLGIVASCIGFIMAKNLKKKRERTILIIKMLSEIKTMIRYRELTVFEIMETLKSNSIYNDLGFINIKHSPALPFSKVWEQSIANDFSLTEPEKNLLTRFGNELGTTDTNGQLAILDCYIKYFEDFLLEIDKHYQNKSKLYRSMGIFTGALIFIIGV